VSKTNIQVSDAVADYIYRQKERGESYDDWLRARLELEDEQEAEA
jgi:hypothetical protein